MLKTVFFTISSWNYLHYAKTLAASLREHHHDVTRIIAIADTRRDELTNSDFREFDDQIFFDELDLPDRRAFSFRYDVMELNTAIKPTVFLQLFAKGYDRVIYLDPDVVAYRPLDDVFDALDGGASTVLTPHSLSPNLQSQSPNDLTFMQAGIYNLGFMALAKTSDTLRLLKWWETRLRTECVSNRLAEGIFVDQKFIDLWPAYCPDVHILRNPAYNVAYWNLDSRTIEQRGSTYEINGTPLAFFHFSGVVPGSRNILSKHQNRWKTSSTPELNSLFYDYHDRLEKNGAQRFAPIPYGFEKFGDGSDIPKVARLAFREKLEPYNADPFNELPGYLNQPANMAPNPGGVVTRIAHALWSTRPDLQSRFDLWEGVSQLRYANWYVSSGAAAAGIPVPFVRPVAERIAALRSQGPALLSPFSGTGRQALKNRVARYGYRLLITAQPHIRWLYAPIPPALRQRFLDTLFNVAWRGDAVAEQRPSLSPGVSLIGYPFAEMGVGEAMRSLARAVESVGIDYDVVNFGEQVRSSQEDKTLDHRVTGTPSKAVNVFCVNADMLLPTIQGFGQGALLNRHNIVRPFWELARINPKWTKGLMQVDEIWAPTTFVRDAFLAGCDRPVLHIPVAVCVPQDIRPDRDRFGIPHDARAFLFAFDFSSYPARKNPDAVLQAFARAFGQDRKRRVALVIKTMGHSPKKREILNAILQLAQDDKRIVLIDKVLTRSEMHCLTASCDVFVSLHRSEGFGLGIAEAMAMGKAVIATDFSGSTDFVNNQTGFPIPFKLVEVQEDDYPYFVEGQKWAEPDIDEAARVMALLADDPEAAFRIGAAAKSHMTTFHSPVAVGNIIEARLKLIHGSGNASMERDTAAPGIMQIG